MAEDVEDVPGSQAIKSTAERRIDDVAHSFDHLRTRFGLFAAIVLAVAILAVIVILNAKGFREGLETIGIFNSASPAAGPAAKLAPGPSAAPPSERAERPQVVPAPAYATAAPPLGQISSAAVRPRPQARKVASDAAHVPVSGVRRERGAKICSISGTTINDSTVLQDCSN